MSEFTGFDEQRFVGEACVIAGAFAAVAASSFHGALQNMGAQATDIAIVQGRRARGQARIAIRRAELMLADQAADADLRAALNGRARRPARP